MSFTNRRKPGPPREQYRRLARRALRLRCPACGRSAMFPALAKTRSFHDWFTPNEGCPRCGIPFQREPGYYLLATWAINYVAACAIGLASFGVADALWHPPVGVLLAVTLVPTVLTAVLLARHSKALFLAMDVWMDPPKPPDATAPPTDGPPPVPAPPEATVSAR